MGLVPTILCGGAGSRLWPISREQHPKPFIKMPDQQSLLQKALLKATALPHMESLLVVTNHELFFLFKNEMQLLEGNQPRCRVILEPFGRNTAAAVAAAALELEALYGKEQVMLVMAADHLISDQESFNKTVAQALSMAQKGKLVTFGIRPHYPETGYGYIEAEGENVLRFVEKPDQALAEQYLAAGNFFWNSGIFCFTVGAILDEFKQYCPQVLDAVRACLCSSVPKSKEGLPTLPLNENLFALVPDISIDYAIMEKSDKLAMLPALFGWSDIGSWEALSQITPCDAAGNITEADVVMHDVTNCYIKSENRVIGALGLDNLLIIDTPDALLVADKSSSQGVKNLYNQLKQADHPAYKLHRQVSRPWGIYTVLEEGPGFKIKRIVVNPGASLSLQMHQHRSEHWIVVNGVALVTNGDKVFQINVNESTYIPAKHKHRLQNNDKDPLIIIEVQSGSYLGEDDIIRFDDIYQRDP